MGRYSGLSRMYRLLVALEHFTSLREHALEFRRTRFGIACDDDRYALQWQAADKAYHKVRRQLLDMASPSIEEMLQSLKDNPPRLKGE